MDKRYFKVNELVSYTGISRRSIYRLIAHQDIPFIYKPGVGYRFDKAKIDAWLRQSEVQPKEAVNY